MLHGEALVLVATDDGVDQIAVELTVGTDSDDGGVGVSILGNRRTVELSVEYWLRPVHDLEADWDL